MVAKRTWLQRPETAKYITEENLPLRLRLVRWVGHQRWLPRGHDRILRLLLNPDTCHSFFFEVGFFGQKYRGDLAHYIDWMVFCYGSAAMTELTLLRECVLAIRSRNSDPILFLDIGANVGHHTLFMAPMADEVIAFEPYPPLQAQIKEKIELNNLANVWLMPFGLGEKDDLLDYYPGEGANSGAGTFLPGEEERHGTAAKLQIKRGDSVLEQKSVGRVAIVKVDVEGFEAAVFCGLSRRIKSDMPIILTELSDESRRQFGSEEAFRQAFYPDAHFSEVTGGNGRSFKLTVFKYETSFEVLITPEEMGWLREALFHAQ